MACNKCIRCGHQVCDIDICGQCGTIQPEQEDISWQKMKKAKISNVQDVVVNNLRFGLFFLEKEITR